VQHREKTAVYIIDKPGAIQSTIMAGHIAPPTNNPDEAAIDVLNTALGGAFTSRLNMNLREDKHWSYGAFTTFVDARGQRPFLAMAPVQSDKTKESLQEIVKEFRAIIRDQPVTEEELKKTQETLTRSLAGQRETKAGLLSDSLAINRFGLAEDYFTAYTGRVNALKRADINGVAEKILRPEKMVYVIVGDRAQIEKGVRELNLGEVRFLDADGNVVK